MQIFKKTHHQTWTWKGLTRKLPWTRCWYRNCSWSWPTFRVLFVWCCHWGQERTGLAAVECGSSWKCSSKGLGCAAWSLFRLGTLLHLRKWDSFFFLHESNEQKFDKKRLLLFNLKANGLFVVRGCQKKAIWSGSSSKLCPRLFLF